jgi:hypothetical protein
MTQQKMTRTKTRIIEALDYVKNADKFIYQDFEKICPNATHSFTLTALIKLGYLERIKKGIYQRIKQIDNPLSLMKKIVKINSDEGKNYYLKNKSYQIKKTSKPKEENKSIELNFESNRHSLLEVQIKVAIELLKTNGYRVQKKTETWEDC